MDSEKNLYPRLAKNIKSLRKAADETQHELAMAVGCDSKSTIVNYEKGTSIPHRDILIKIAKHYKITEDELLYGDFSDIKKSSNKPINDKKANKEALLTMLPLIHSEKALSNKYFKTSYNGHIILIQDMFEKEHLDLDLYDKIIYLYKQAEKEGVIEAVANQLWWFLFQGSVLSNLTSKLYYNIDILKNQKIKTKDLIKNYILPTFDEEPDEITSSINEAQKEFLESYACDIIDGISKLKKSKNTEELGDYYLALQYFFNLIPNNLSPEMNKTIGLEMLEIFKYIGNPYAKNFLDLIINQ